MATTTPNLGLTIPTGSEHVSRQIINENMQKIDNNASILSEKDNVQLESGVTANEANVWKYGKIGHVSFRGMKRSSTGSGWTKIGTLPAGYVPHYATYFLLANDSDMSNGVTTVFECRLSSNGDIEVYSPQANKNMWGGVTYIIG